jgi:hypothetical protein
MEVGLLVGAPADVALTSLAARGLGVVGQLDQTGQTSQTSTRTLLRVRCLGVRKFQAPSLERSLALRPQECHL